MYDDRFSIWTEGVLPEGLTFEDLRIKHPSRPHNPIIADVCFKGGYIETWGTGTLKIINACKEASLPEPEIKEANGGILVILFKDRFTEERLQRLGLNERQIKAVIYVKEKGRIANKEYISLFNVSRITATRDLNGLVDRKIFKNSKIKGAGSFYELIAS